MNALRITNVDQSLESPATRNLLADHIPTHQSVAVFPLNARFSSYAPRACSRLPVASAIAAPPIKSSGDVPLGTHPCFPNCSSLGTNDLPRDRSEADRSLAYGADRDFDQGRGIRGNRTHHCGGEFVAGCDANRLNAIAPRNAAVVDAGQVHAGQAGHHQGAGEPLQYAVLLIAQDQKSRGHTIVRRGPETGDTVIG